MSDDREPLSYDRRHTDTPPGGYGRRREDAEENWRLTRDKALFALGVSGVIALTVVAITVGVKNEALALAALAVFAGLLGAPTVLRLDERRHGDR